MKGEGGGRKAEGDHLLWQGAEIARCHSERSEESPSGGEILRCAQDDQVSLRLLIDPPAAGPWNMAVDEALLETADRGQCTLRFYQWQQPTLSLGYFQPYEDRWRHEASGSCIAVRRASGGGAIVHDVEVTYSLAIPARHCLAADRLGLYRAVHVALIETLANWGIHAALCWPPPRVSQAKDPFLCFQRRAAGDVLFSEAKIAGSAQRRCRGAVLQHGSVLLDRSLAAPELPGISELTGRRIEPPELIRGWLDRLVGPRPIGWQVEALSDQERSRAAELVDIKYGAAAWTENRGRRGTCTKSPLSVTQGDDRDLGIEMR